METKENEPGRELVITRLLNAPVSLVWEVWTNPEHIINWWGPDGFTNTIHRMELEPGGAWDLTMHGPDGRDYKNKSLFQEVIPEKRIVFQHMNPNFVATIEFEARGNKTFLSWRMLFETSEQLQQVIKVFKADEGLQQNVTKLESYLLKIGIGN